MLDIASFFTYNLLIFLFEVQKWKKNKNVKNVGIVVITELTIRKDFAISIRQNKVLAQNIVKLKKNTIVVNFGEKIRIQTVYEKQYQEER